MKLMSPKPLRCAIYTRKSTEHNLDLAFNSLDAQREACEAYVKSQAHEGWTLVPDRFDDGGLSGASLDRPALQLLLQGVGDGRVDVIVVYKVDRLTRSLADFAKLVELFDAHEASFVSVTQAFNTTSSTGRLTLNVLLSFAWKCNVCSTLIGVLDMQLGAVLASGTVLASSVWPIFLNSIAFASRTHGAVLSKKPMRGPRLSEQPLSGLAFGRGGIN
jgi:hypothetical protein